MNYRYNNSYEVIDLNNTSLQHYIEDNKLCARSYDWDEQLKLFINEMEAGLNGALSSLLMLPSYVYLGNGIKKNKRIVVIDAGGTNLRTALVWFDEDSLFHIEGFKKIDMPGSRAQISKDTFFSSIAEALAPYMQHSDTIVMSFAYPTEISSMNEGKVITLVKELKVEGIEGCYLNRELGIALYHLGFQDTKILITNDTVATAMAGFDNAQQLGIDTSIGLIVGTGTNICYPEYCKNIRKMDAADTGRMLINMESGNFDKFVRGPIDIAFDESTINPGYHQLEKMVGGGYFGAFSSLVIQRAAAEGLLSVPLPNHTELASSDIAGFLEQKKGAIINRLFEKTSDRMAIRTILEALVDRAAHLIALELAAASIKAAGNRERIYATAEGTMFYKMPGIRQKVSDIMDTWLNKKYGLHVLLAEQDYAVVRGEAIIALMC